MGAWKATYIINEKVNLMESKCHKSDKICKVEFNVEGRCLLKTDQKARKPFYEYMTLLIK